MKRFPAKTVAQRIDFENNWWKSGMLDKALVDKPKRSFFPVFFKNLTNNYSKSIVLYGAKRVGKTTFIFQAIQELINKGFRKQNLVYLSLENPIFYRYKLYEIIEIIFSSRSNVHTEPYYFFFDKIQYYSTWENELLDLIKKFDNIRFVFCGSMNRLNIKYLKSIEEEFVFFRLPTFTFFEYVNFVHDESYFECDENSENCNLELLDDYFIDYLKFGGHPELILKQNHADEAVRLLRNRILNRFTLKAFPSLAGIDKIDEINAFVAYLMINTGKITSIKKMAVEVDLSEKLVQQYIHFLQNIFFVRILRPYNTNNSVDFKVYIANPSFILAVFDYSSITKYIDFNYLVETAILAQWEHLQRPFYYHDSEEFSITFISKSKQDNIDWCTLVNYNGKSLKNKDKFAQFCEQQGIYFPIIITKNNFKTIESNGLLLSNQPSSLYCYQVGRHIIESQLIED